MPQVGRPARVTGPRGGMDGEGKECGGEKGKGVSEKMKGREVCFTFLGLLTLSLVVLVCENASSAGKAGTRFTYPGGIEG